MGCIWTPPQSDKACFLCVVYVQQSPKHHPNIHGDFQTYGRVHTYLGGIPNIGVPKHTGKYPNIWGHPNIQEGVQTWVASKHTGGYQTYREHPNLLGVSKHMGLPNIWGIQTYQEGVQTYGGVQTWGHPNTQGASKHTGDASKISVLRC